MNIVIEEYRQEWLRQCWRVKKARVLMCMIAVLVAILTAKLTPLIPWVEVAFIAPWAVGIAVFFLLDIFWVGYLVIECDAAKKKYLYTLALKGMSI